MPKRVDANQPDIVRLFRQMGCSVLILSEVGKGCPDICVGYHGQNFLVEIKDGSKPLSKQKLTPDERKFFAEWRGHVEVIRSVDDVIRFIREHPA